MHSVYLVVFLAVAFASFAHADYENGLRLRQLVVVKDACSEDDLLHTTKENFKQQLVDCESECSLNHGCIKDCLNKLGMRDGCSSCFAQEAQCLTIRCRSQCADIKSTQCHMCSEKHCSKIGLECARGSVHLAQE